MRRYGAVIEVGGGVVDCCEDEIIGLGYILYGGIISKGDEYIYMV